MARDDADTATEPERTAPLRSPWLRWRRRIPTATALLCSSVGVVGILAGVGALRSDLAGDASLWSGLPLISSVAGGVLCLILARGLSRRQRTAWQWLTVSMGFHIVVLAAAAVADGGQPVGGHGVRLRLAISVLLLTVVVAAGGEFTAARPRRSRSVTTLLTSLAVLGPLASWSVLTAFSPGTAGGTHRAVCGAWYLVRWFVAVPPPHLQAAPPAWIPPSVGAAGAVAVILAAYLTLRRSRGNLQAAGVHRSVLRDLLTAHGGRDSLGYFALRADKAVVLSDTGRSAICYRPVNGVSLAAGDPIGAPSDWPRAIRAWQDEAITNGWTPAVLGASLAGARAYARAGLRVLEIGDEAVVHVDEFHLDGRSMRGVRQAVGRIRRAGYRAHIHRVGDIAPSTTDELGRWARQWRDGSVERGFSMALGRFAHPDDLEYVVVEVRDSDGRPRAVLGFVPWGADGLSLDLMRRDPESPNGLVEFSVVELLTRADAMGVRRVSLNFAMFRSAFARGEQLGAGPLLRWWRGVLMLASRRWQLESLYRANLKYQPVWIPRFVCYPRGRDLPRVAVAAAVAEGFIGSPRLRRRMPAPRAVAAAPAAPAPVTVGTGVRP